MPEGGAAAAAIAAPEAAAVGGTGARQKDAAFPKGRWGATLLNGDDSSNAPGTGIMMPSSLSTEEKNRSIEAAADASGVTEGHGGGGVGRNMPGRVETRA